jgi:hypothetical protein
MILLLVFLIGLYLGTIFALKSSKEFSFTFSMKEKTSTVKPPVPAGDKLRVKIQRLGKEPLQGVGYLDDGTMVVVNGGGDFIGETLEVIVLSAKQTSAGRMIFCNAKEEGELSYAND